MTNVLVRDVSGEVHEALRRKAAERHLSLQEYLSIELRRLAERRSIGEVLDEVERRRGGRIGLAAAVDDLATERAAR